LGPSDIRSQWWLDTCYLSLLALLAVNLLPGFPIPASVVTVLAVGSALAVMLSDDDPPGEGHVHYWKVVRYVFHQAPVEFSKDAQLSNTASFVNVGARLISAVEFSDIHSAGLAGGGWDCWLVLIGYFHHWF
jgi:hypothetical protein